jgi:hypothetical protein
MTYDADSMSLCADSMPVSTDYGAALAAYMCEIIALGLAGES